MKKRALIIKNISHEDPGILSIILDEYNIKYDIIDLSKKVALTEFYNSEFLKEVFGEEHFKNFYYAKLEEFNAYRTNVSQWERDRYITRL